MRTKLVSCGWRELGITAAAVQQKIQSFEFDLDAELFERKSGKKPQLTELGKQFYFQALEIIPKLQNLELQAQAIYQGVESHLSIAVHGYALFPRIQQLLIKLKQRYPTVHLELQDAENSAQKADKMRIENPATLFEADIVIGPSYLSSVKGVNVHIVDRINWLVVAAASHPLAKINAELSSVDLSQHAQRFPNEGLVSISELMENIRLSSNTINYSDFFLLREGLVSGLGFGFYPQQLAQPLIDEGKLVALELDFDDGTMNWGIDMLWTDNLGEAGRWFVEQLTEA